MCAQLLLPLCANSFETILMFWSWSEDVHMLWIKLTDYFSLLFPQIELSRFLGVNQYQDMNVLYRIKFSDF